MRIILSNSLIVSHNVDLGKLGLDDTLFEKLKVDLKEESDSKIIEGKGMKICNL